MDLSNMTVPQIQAAMDELSAQALADQSTIQELQVKLAATGIPLPFVHPFIGKEVAVRTYSAGVHIGKLVHNEGTVAVLSDARRLWSWKGAFTLNEVVMKGVGNGSRISARAEAILLTEAIELLPVSPAALASLEPTE